MPVTNNYYVEVGIFDQFAGPFQILTMRYLTVLMPFARELWHSEFNLNGPDTLRPVSVLVCSVLTAVPYSNYSNGIFHRFDEFSTECQFILQPVY